MEAALFACLREKNKEGDLLVGIRARGEFPRLSEEYL